MLPCNQILVPTDFSEPSYKAVLAAGELAHHFSSTLWVVHVVPPIPVPHGTIPAMPPGGAQPELHPGFDIVAYRQELENSAMESLKEVIKQRVRPPVKGAYPLVLWGDAAPQITSCADEKDVDLVVIATHGRTGWRRLAFGSVAEKVVRLATCPVLTIHQESEEKKGE